MSLEPLISQQIRSGNNFLWTVKTYLDLISRDDPLVYGSGLKRLYSMASGVATLNDGDIEAITRKSERLGLVTNNLRSFMESCVLKNIELYGKELQKIIYDRIVSISNGDIRNPTPVLKFNPDEARRYYYVPPASFTIRLKKALLDDVGDPSFRGNRPATVTLQDIANDSDLLLTRMQITEGHLSPTESSFGSLASCVEGLIAVLEQESKYAADDNGYKLRARPALKILWFIGKSMMGDLTTLPMRKDVNLVDLDKKLNLSDGTLAAIPFPLRETANLFSDDDNRGVTIKGRFYLSAVSAAAFYRSKEETVD